MNIKNNPCLRTLIGIAIVCVAALFLSACQKSEPAAEAKNEPAHTEAAADSAAGVQLSAEEIEKLGIVTTPAKAANFTPETEGYGVVLSHDAIAQAVAEVATAQAAVQQSRAALARVQRLAGTPGAFPAENQESAERQAASDAAALTLAQRRLSASLGQHPPWQDTDNNAVLNDLAGGRSKLVRVTFPLGVLSGATPHSVRIAHLDPNSAAESWKTTTVWDAPADATVPGRSFFALLKDGDAGEGERLQVWAPAGATESGAWVPASAAVISEGKYWCYVEKQAHSFERKPIDTGKPMEDGYFIEGGIAVNDAVVTTGAGLLLAREINPSTEAEE